MDTTTCGRDLQLNILSEVLPKVFIMKIVSCTDQVHCVPTSAEGIYTSVALHSKWLQIPIGFCQICQTINIWFLAPGQEERPQKRKVTMFWILNADSAPWIPDDIYLKCPMDT